MYGALILGPTEEVSWQVKNFKTSPHFRTLRLKVTEWGGIMACSLDVNNWRVPEKGLAVVYSAEPAAPAHQALAQLR